MKNCRGLLACAIVAFVSTLTNATLFEGLARAQTTVAPSPDQAALLSQIQKAWVGFREALHAKDLDRAMSFVASYAQPRYRPAIAALMSKGVDFDTIYPPSPLTLIEANANVARFKLVRSGEAFVIRFVRDPDGSWKIDSL